MRAYLVSLEDRQANGGTPGKRKMTPERLEVLRQRVAAKQEKIDVTTSPMRKLKLVTERIELEDQIAQGLPEDDEAAHAELEAQVIEVMGQWCIDYGIGFRALRAVGVPYRVLRDAGVDLETNATH